MNKNAKIILGGMGALGAIAGGLFLFTRKGSPAVVPATIAPTPQPAPIAAAPIPVPEIHVSPSVEASPYETPPEQWTQEQAAQVTNDKGNEARNAVGKLFGF